MHSLLRSAAGVARRSLRVRASNDPVATAPVPQLPASSGPVMVWFQHDLRVADHPGLLAAINSGAPQLLPFFCLDPQLYAPLCLLPSGPAVLLAALARLRQQLRAVGSDLVVRVGPAATTTAAIAGAAGVKRIVIERQEESRWLEAGHMLAQQLDSSALPTRISSWQAPLWQQGSFKPNFKDWKESRGQALAPLPAPGKVPPLPAGFEPGTLPGLSTLQQLLEDALAAGPAEAAVAAAAAAAANGKAGRSSSPSSGRSSPTFGGRTAAQAAAAAAQLWGPDRAAAREQVLEQMLQEPSTASVAAAAAKIAQLLLPSELHTSSSEIHGEVPSSSRELRPEDILEAYLTADTTASPEPRLAFLRSSVSELEVPAAPGASFLALLGPLLGLGVLSSRQVYAKTLAAEVARWGGRMPLLGPGTVTAKAALAAVELNDFHRQLAGHIPQEGDAGTARGDPPARGSSSSSPAATSSWWGEEPVASAAASFDEAPDGVSQWGITDWPAGLPRRCSWRWRGALTDFCVVEPRNPKPGAPAIVLVHGFGAFGDQWRFNLGPLSEAGYRVFAPTLPGFGRSEKAALQYSQNAWRDFIRDFLVCVVGSPAVLAGNSIGGFIAASAAADYPSLVAGLALLNSAGPVTPGYTAADAAAAAAATSPSPNPWLVRAGTAALMLYLRSSIAKQLKWLYPTNPDNADEWLEQEIYRAACDSRSADVFASVFYLPKPRPLNFLVNDLWKGPTAVIQGVLDPLNDAQARSDLLVQQCAPVGLRAWNIQAGHCPHDEQPELVNAVLLEFIEQMVEPTMQCGSSSSSSPAVVGAAASKAHAAAAAADAAAVRRWLRQLRARHREVPAVMPAMQQLQCRAPAKQAHHMAPLVEQPERVVNAALLEFNEQMVEPAMLGNRTSSSSNSSSSSGAAVVAAAASKAL
uniref:Photolyase/cryptochrome alpha/beta domain-containing protein n=1 Tax=Tetradesmus obliquus TaxID=3088 RepID=A0A383VQC0_TETOB|eukprot:jgi/Sobl393_1/15085/SZX67707.1